MVSRRAFLFSVVPLLVVSGLSSRIAFSQDGESGDEFLTLRERERFRARTQDAATEQERARIRDERRLLVEERQLGLTERERQQLREARSEQERDRIRGSAGSRNGDLLTEQERARFHARLRDAQNEQERRRIMAEHRALITERAQERGTALPAPRGQPPGRGGGGRGR